MGCMQFVFTRDPGGNSYLDLKLGQIIENEKETLGENSHKAINSGEKGLVLASAVRIVTYNEITTGNYRMI